MTPRRNKILVCVVIVVLMMGMAVVSFLMVQAWEDKNPSPYEQPHHYSFSGTFSGSECLGEGDSKYVSESSTEYLYIVDYTLHHGGIDSSYSFGLAFDLDEKMEPASVYTDTGESIFEDQSVHIWKAELDGVSYTYYVGNHCNLIAVSMLSEDLDIMGKMTE